MLDVCLLGTGGMMPLPYRRLTSLMARFNGMSILIDCGEGTQIAIKEKGWSFKPIDLICFTHYHADHISGLPGLLLTMGNAERKKPLVMIGPRGLTHVVNSLRVIAPELPFPIEFIEIQDMEETFTFNGFCIDAFRVQHNVTCYGFSIRVPRTGKFLVDKAREAGVPQCAWNRLQKGELVEVDGVLYTPEMVLGEERKGIKVTYCTDTRPVPMIAKHAEGADLFICEGMYGEPEKKAKAMEYRHMTFLEAAQLAKLAQPKELWLTHYSPSLVRPEPFMDQVRQVFAQARAGEDLKFRQLDFEDED
ncbi:MAG: ribonuclease Z [Lachnospiraceae bacterium]